MKQNYVTLAEYKVLEEQYHNAHITSIEEEDKWRATLKDMRKRILPEVGMGATEVLYSDLRAKTITRVISPNKIEVMENKTNCIDYFGDVYEILDEINPYMRVETYTRRKSGMWRMEGRPDKRGEVWLDITRRSHSIDPTF